MTTRSYRPSIAFAFLSAALLAGCNGGAAVPGTPTGLGPGNDPARNANGIRIWAAPATTESGFKGLIYGLSAGGKKLLTVIHTGKQTVPGYNPSALKVDHDQNLWVLDQDNSTSRSSSESGVIQEYTPTGSFTAAYVPSCPAAPNLCDSFTGASLTDVVVSPSYVFAIGNFYWSYQSSAFVCNPCNGYEFWPNGQPNATPSAVIIGDGNTHYVPRFNYGDIDSSNNLWLEAGYIGYSGYGLAEFKDPTNVYNPEAITVEPYGTYANPGFVYTSNAGKTLNVEVPPSSSQYGANIYQYALPLYTNGAPIKTLTPCLVNCYPADFGFNKTAKQVVVGDGSGSAGWIDIGKAANNSWSQITNPQFSGRFGAAAYTPSDK